MHNCITSTNLNIFALGYNIGGRLKFFGLMFCNVKLKLRIYLYTVQFSIGE